MNNTIETHGLACRFGRTEALHGLDLTVPAGSITALLGPNGAGKSTTLKLLVNQLVPTAGSAFVLGVNSRKLAPSELSQIGYVSENQELPLWMTLRQLIDYCRPFYPTWDRGLERTLLAQFALPESRKLEKFSRGMLMKSALLTSLAYRPKLLLLDEPFSGLDPLVREEFVHGILEISRAGDWTVLVSSHDIEEVERLCDRVVLLDAGRKRVDETTEVLQARFRRVEVTLPFGNAAGETVPTSWLELERAGSLIRFVDTAFDGAKTMELCGRYFPGGAMSAHPMSLREIFITLARAGRTQPEGVSL